MNAFIQILEQLIFAVQTNVWPLQRFYPFPSQPAAPVKVFDACVFRQDAGGAIGIAWLKCEGHEPLLTFPFRIARYSQDGDLISLTPWSLRESTADPQFYSTWMHLAATAGKLPTFRGGALACRQFEAQSSFNIINLWTDSKNTCTRVETQHLCKIFRLVSTDQPYSMEAEILEYLNSQNHFLQHPELTVRYDFYPANTDGPGLPVAIVTRYIQSDAKLWQELTASIQHARYPDPMKERASRLSWYSIIETVSKLGRLLADFHVAMTNGKKNLLITPETNTGEAKEQWLEKLLQKLNERIYTLRSHAQTLALSQQDINDISDFSYQLFEQVKAADHLGLLIRIHGHAHLGQVLIGDDTLFLVNYETDGLDEEDYRLQKQSCLKDLAGMLVSLKFAWHTTERSHDFPVFGDLVSPESEYGRHVKRGAKNFAEPKRYHPALGELENIFVRSYLQSIAEDTAAVELLPVKKTDLESLYDFSFLLRILKETVRDLGHQNPRSKTDLRILSDFIHGRLVRPNFESFYADPMGSNPNSPAEAPYGTDADFS